MTFKPIGKQILVEYVENKPVGDILLPDNSVTLDFSMFVVVAVGEGYLTNGGYVPLPVAPGDRVKISGAAKGEMVALEPWLVADRKLALVDIQHVLGIWEGDLPSPKIARKIIKGAELVH